MKGRLKKTCKMGLILTGFLKLCFVIEGDFSNSIMHLLQV